MITLLIISGATATGKTDLGIHLAKRYNGELVSADSRQIYTGLDIVSGKDIRPGVLPVYRRKVRFRGVSYPLVTYDMHGVPIWLYDAVTPHELCSISLYRTLAIAAITDIVARGKLPIVVGGAGLYIDAISEPPETISIPRNAGLRKRLDTLTVGRLQEELASVSSDRLDRLNNSDRQNPRRLIRAIETALWQKKHPVQKAGKEVFDCFRIGLRLSMDDLAASIAHRVGQRWKDGAPDEVKEIASRGGDLPSATALGIVPIREFLAGRLSEREAKARWIRQEVSYAKRQMVWFAARQDIHWFDSAKDGFSGDVESIVSAWYTTIKLYADKN